MTLPLHSVINYVLLFISIIMFFKIIDSTAYLRMRQLVILILKLVMQTAQLDTTVRLEPVWTGWPAQLEPTVIRPTSTW